MLRQIGRRKRESERGMSGTIGSDVTISLIQAPVDKISFELEHFLFA